MKKLVQLATGGNEHGIDTSIDGTLYQIRMIPIEVSEEIANKLHIQFGHLIEISDSSVDLPGDLPGDLPVT